MLKSISLLVGALSLTTMFSVAKADGDKTITILTVIEAGKPSVSVELTDGATIKGDNITFDNGLVHAEAKRISMKNVALAGKKGVAAKGNSQSSDKTAAVRRGLTTTTIIRNNFEFVGKDAVGNPLLFKFKEGVAIVTTTRIEPPKVAIKPKS